MTVPRKSMLSTQFCDDHDDDDNCQQRIIKIVIISSSSCSYLNHTTICKLFVLDKNT